MEINDEILLGYIQWTRSQRLFCKMRTFKGKIGLDIRLFYQESESDDWLPSPKGIWVPIKKAQEFHDLIENAYTRMKTIDSEQIKPTAHESTIIPESEDKELTIKGQEDVSSRNKNIEGEESDKETEDLLNDHLRSK